MKLEEKLEFIQTKKSIDTINFCMAGVGIIFYYGEFPITDYDNYKKDCSVDKYYPTLTEAINEEYKIIRASIKKPRRTNRIEYNREYYLKNKEKIQARRRVYHKKNFVPNPRVYIHKTKEERDNVKKKWFNSHKKEVNAYRRDRYKNSSEVREKTNQVTERWRKNNIERVRKKASENYYKRKQINSKEEIRC